MSPKTVDVRSSDLNQPRKAFKIGSVIWTAVIVEDVIGALRRLAESLR